MNRMLQVLALMAIVVSVIAIPLVGAQTTNLQAFERTWARTDKPVNDHEVDRTWMWGPQENAIQKTEPYAGAPGGQRTVVYYDKSRMEDNAYRGTEPVGCHQRPARRRADLRRDADWRRRLRLPRPG